jgi:hypothetical protein
MKLFLPVSGFQDCLKIQWDLNKLMEWCDRNTLLLNVGKCKTMDEQMTFSEHVDVMVAKAFAMLGFIRRLLLEFRDPYTLKSLYTFLVRPKLEYASCVWKRGADLRSVDNRSVFFLTLDRPI